MKPHAIAGGGFSSVHTRFTYADVAEFDWPALAAADCDARERERGRRSFVLRALDEQRSLLAFSTLLAELCEAGAPIDVIGAATRVVRDEARHVELCGRVVDALGGWPAGAPAPQWVRDDPRSPLRDRILRGIVGSLCVGETLSVALLAGVRAQAGHPVVRGVLTQMLADESLHSRFGWWWLARERDTLTNAERAGIDAYLPRVFAALQRSVRPAASALARQQPFVHGPFGTLSPQERETIFMTCMHETVLPGLESAGLRAQAAFRASLAAREETT